MPAKNKLIALLLIVAVISSSFSRVLMYAGFEMNQKYIAQNLCINKDRPWLHCNGHCYFMKKIQQAEEKEKSDNSQSQKNRLQETDVETIAKFYFHTHLLQLINTP